MIPDSPHVVGSSKSATFAGQGRCVRCRRTPDSIQCATATSVTEDGLVDDDIIIACLGPQDVRGFAEIMVLAFGTEGTNQYVFDFARGDAWAARIRAAVIEVQSYYDSGARILVAWKGSELVGGAILSRSHSRSLVKRFPAILRWVVASLPMATAVRWGRAFRLARALKVSKHPEPPYYTLAALAVHPAHQGGGIGRLLLEEIHRVSDQAVDSTGVYLYTADQTSKEMYERAGYRTLEERRCDHLTVYHMFRRNTVHRGTD